jgi:hypothetical protein
VIETQPSSSLASTPETPSDGGITGDRLEDGGSTAEGFFKELRAVSSTEHWPLRLLLAHRVISLRCPEFGRYRGTGDMAGLAAGSTRSRMTQTVQKRFSSSKNCTQPGTICVDTTV